MTDRLSISVIIPAYNEHVRISQTISDIRNHFSKQGRDYEIIVVADGTDGTREAVAELARTDTSLQVMGEPQRRGKGRAVREGVLRARGEIIGFVDADNKTPISEFDRLEHYLLEGYPIAIGSRSLPQSQIERRQPFLRHFGSKGFRHLLSLLIGLRDIPDTQCGFKFFLRDAALDLFRRQKIDGYMFDIETMCLAKQLGFKIAQLPVRWRDDGDSRLDILSGNWRNLLDVLRIKFSYPADTRRRSLP